MRRPARQGLPRAGRRTIGALVAVATLLSTPTAEAADQRLTSSVAASRIGDAKRTMLGLYVTSLEAAAALETHSDIVLIDVRSTRAALRDGVAAPTRGVVPFLVPSPPERVADDTAAAQRINPDFVAAVERLVGTGEAGRRRTILVICPDGSHSALAVDHLADNAFRNVYLIIDGATGEGGDAAATIGWRRNGLPWLAVPRPEQITP